VNSTSIFIWPQIDDISEIETKDVTAFLPEPVEGRRGGMTFPVSFSGLHVFKIFLFTVTQFVFSIESRSTQFT
jgi:hypothetical protein